MADEWRDLTERSKTTDVDGTDVHHYDEGTGSPILLLHGGGLTSCAELNWGAVLDPLRKRCRAVAPDQPGFGFTDPRGDRDHLPQQRADFIAEFCRTLDLEGVTVVGNSRAGFQALYLALEYPELVEAVVVVNAGSASRELAPTETPGQLDSERPTKEGAREFLEGFEENHLVRPENHPLFRGGITEYAVDRVLEIQRRNWKWTNGRSERIQTSATALNEALSYEGRHVTAAAPAVTQPALVTWSTRPYEGWPRRTDEPPGGASKKFVTVRRETRADYERDEGFDQGIHLFERMPTAELHVWHGADHHVMTDRAEAWVDVVAGFVTRVRE